CALPRSPRRWRWRASKSVSEAARSWRSRFGPSPNSGAASSRAWVSGKTAERAAMWSLHGPPRISQSEVWTRMPAAFCKPRRTDWADANRGGAWLGSFLEGPSFDRAGNLYVADIPHGRIFRIDAAAGWTLVAEYDGWPNGTAFH